MAMNNYQPTSHTIQDGAIVNGLAGGPDSEATEREEALVAQAGMEAVVEIRDLTKTYKLGRTKVRALRGVSLAVQRGEFVAIMGPSGSGKSTLMNLVGCLDRPTSGEYRLSGKTVSKMSADELADIRNQQIGFVFQGFNLLTRATALKNVVLPLMYAGLSGQEQLRRARKMLQLVGLGARMDHKPAELSGGQQQSVAIARALVNNPALLLADEPTGNLDSRTSLEVMAVLQALNRRGLTILLVTHDADIAAFTKRQVVFRDGRIVRDEVVAAPRLAEVDWLATRQSTRIQQVAHVQADSARESEAESQ
jgi:putative ABC transport system ATP-binding protein